MNDDELRSYQKELGECEILVKNLESDKAALTATCERLAGALEKVADCSDRTIDGDVLVFRSVMEQASAALAEYNAGK